MGSNSSSGLGRGRIASPVIDIGSFAGSFKLSTAHHAALGEWQSERYRSIQNYNRTGKTGGRLGLKDLTGKIDSAINANRIPRDIQTFRGIGGEQVLGLKKGATFSDRGFVASSLSLETAKLYARSRDDGAILRVAIPRGTRAAYVQGGETEVLLGRGTRFRVTGISRGSQGERVVDVRVLRGRER